MTQHDPRDPRDPLAERLVLDARPGPAARISKERASAMVDAALDAALFDKALFDKKMAPELRQSAESPKQVSGLAALFQHPVARAFVIAAAALLMLVGGAAAAKLALQTFFAHEAPAAPKAVQPKQLAPQPQAVKAGEMRDTEETLDAEEEPAAIDAEGAPRRTQRDAREAAAEEEDLLQRANRARTAGRFREAAETYALVYERHGGTLSAYVAAVAAGSLELEHLDSPTRAAKLFRRALRTRPNGALDLEARQGLALALRDMGRERDEIAALRSLIHAHPDRPAAARARARLQELDAKPDSKPNKP